MTERVERVGGQLIIDSQPGQGTRVVVLVPVVGPTPDVTRAVSLRGTRRDQAKSAASEAFHEENESCENPDRR